MWYVICVLAGVDVGVFLMSLMAMASDDYPKPQCTGNCNQGRSCTCWQTRQRFDDESA